MGDAVFPYRGPDAGPLPSEGWAGPDTSAAELIALVLVRRTWKSCLWPPARLSDPTLDPALAQLKGSQKNSNWMSSGLFADPIGLEKLGKSSRLAPAHCG